MRRRQFMASAALLVAGCAREKKLVIGVVPKGRSHLFWKSVQAGAVKASRETNVDILWNGPATETDFNGQLQIVESMINRRVDAIALAPIDKKSMVNVVERAAREKIPVIIFDSGIDTDQFVSQVATDNYKAGQLAADRMGKILGGKGKVVILAVQVGAASTMAREQGFEDRIKESYPEITIADKRFGDADVAKSLRAAENMLTAHPDVKGIFASNESSTVGAAQALKQRQMNVKLVGFDAGPVLESELRTGVIDSLVVQHPFKMGYDAVHSAVRKLRGQEVTKIQNLEPRLVVRQDLSNPDVQAQLNPDLKQFLE